MRGSECCLFFYVALLAVRGADFDVVFFCPVSSRKPFTPPGHWLVSSQIDMQSFIEAAVYAPVFHSRKRTYSQNITLASKNNNYPNQPVPVPSPSAK